MATATADIQQYDMVRLKNEGDTPFISTFANRRFRIEPGNDAFVPWDAMCLWLGDPNTVDLDDVRRYRLGEVRRLRIKYGAYEHDALWEEHRPQLKAFTLEGDPIVTVVDDPDGKHVTPEVQTQAENDLLREAMFKLQRQVEMLSNRLEENQRTQAGEDMADHKSDDTPQRPEPEGDTPPPTKQGKVGGKAAGKASGKAGEGPTEGQGPTDDSTLPQSTPDTPGVVKVGTPRPPQGT